MTEDRHNLEEISRNEAWLATMLEETPAPPPSVLDRVRMAVQIERDRNVIAPFAHPAPDDVLLGRVRGAVAGELGRRHRSPRARRIVRLVELLAAAAVLVIAVDVARLAVSTRPGATLVDRADPQEVVEEMASAFQSVGQRRDAALSVLSEDIGRAENTLLTDRHDASDVELREIGDEVDTLFAPQGTAWEM
jgi:hypothetical protein